MLSSLSEAQQAAAFFTLCFPTDCFLLRLIIYQGEHLPNSPPEELVVVSGQSSSRGCKAGQLRDTTGTGQPGEQEKAVLPLTACPTPE